MISRKWVRITKGKGMGRSGYVDHSYQAPKHPGSSWIKFPGAPYPRDMAEKCRDTFVRLSEMECAVMEMRG
jgi:hypothetical protein